MNKGLIYSLIAAVLGVLLVIVPLFYVPTIESAEYREAESTIQKFLERMKIFESTNQPKENMTQSILNSVLTFAIGFAVAAATHLFVKAKFSHKK